MVKKKKPTVKPSLAQELQAVKISTNLMAQEMTTLKPMVRQAGMQITEVRSLVLDLRDDPDVIERREQPTINQEQLNQLYAAVNKIAAMAAAMDDTKKMMIKLTSKRIQKVDARLTKLRVRLKRLEG